MKKSSLLPLTIAAALALAGCASSNAAGESGAPPRKPPLRRRPARPSRPESSWTPRSLADIAQEIAGDNEKAVIIDKDALMAQLPLAEQQMKSMKIEPAQCATFVSADLSAEFEKMNMISRDASR